MQRPKNPRRQAPIVSGFVLAVLVPLLASGIAARRVGGCGEEEVPPLPPPAPNRASAQCGSPGDVVELSVQRQGYAHGSHKSAPCNTSQVEVVFGGGVTAKPTRADGTVRDGRDGSNRLQESERCLLEVVIPEGAKTGPIRVNLTVPELSKDLEEPAIFAVPCGADAGAEGGTQGDPDASVPKDPWAGEVRVSVTPPPVSGATGAAAIYPSTTAAEAAALEKLEGVVRKRSTFGVPLGSCGPGSLPEPDPAGLPAAGIDVGSPITAEQGGSTFLSMARGANNFYAGNASSVTVGAGSLISIAVPGAAKVPAISIDVDVPPKPNVTSPAANGTLSKGGFNITYDPFTATSFLITVGTLPRFYCNADPKAGSIAVPSSLLSSLPSGSTLFEFKTENASDHTVVVDGQPRRITSFRFLTHTIGSVLN